MSLPDTDTMPDDPQRLPPARRRRARRLLAPLSGDERTAFYDELAHRTAPTFDFFLLSFVASLVLGAGLFLNAPSLLLLGILAAPFIGPVVGLSFGTVIGSIRFFLRCTAGLVIGALMAFWAGAIAGTASFFGEPAPPTLAYTFTQLSWTNFIVLAVGVILAALGIMRSERHYLIPGLAIAFELYLPLVAAGFGLSSQLPDLWPDGLVVFAVYLSWAALLGALAFAMQGFRPANLFGYTLGGAVFLLGIILLMGLSSTGAVVTTQMGLPSATPTLTATRTPIPPTHTPTPTPAPPTLTPTPTQPTLTHTPTQTLPPSVTHTPAPVYAYINANAGNPPGAWLRTEPGGDVIRTYLNNTLVEVLSETQEVGNTVWIKVRVIRDGQEGWIVRDLILVATPSPDW